MCFVCPMLPVSLDWGWLQGCRIETFMIYDALYIEKKHFCCILNVGIVCYFLLSIKIFVYRISKLKGSSWWWSYGSWIYNYLYSQFLSLLKLWVRIPLMARFSPDTPISSTNKTDRHDIAEILLKVALNTITLTLPRNRVGWKQLWFMMLYM